MNRWNKLRRGGALLLVGGTLGLAGGCDSVDELLQVENPERILERDLDDPRLVDVMVNSAVGQFQNAFDNPFVWVGSLLTDEQVTGINWEDFARVNQRIVPFDESPTDDMFSELSEARVMADTVAARMRNLVENVDSDPRLARALVYAGYSYILLADAMCEATINAGDKVYQPVELYQIAVTKLEEALRVAQAANHAGLANLARAGLARAHLNIGNNDQVMRYAGEVSQDFVWWVEYSDADPALYNVLYTRTRGGNHALGVHPEFVSIYADFRTNPIVDQTDPRIQFTPEWTRGHNALTPLYKPFQPLLHSGFTGKTVAEICEGVAECDEKHILGTGQLELPNQGSDIALATGLTALHDFYEAAGPNGTGPAGSTLEFVNARRAFGNQEPVQLSGDALMAELREQRARDLYLAGFRLGDLRRWLRQGVGDFFPSGQTVNERWGTYGDVTCFPLPRAEYEGNPNVKRG